MGRKIRQLKYLMYNNPDKTEWAMQQIAIYENELDKIKSSPTPPQK